ncbi:uncharacterized protein DSM5745_02702 [Aspergillus mulundensis]|uniref:Uncharacterized protein n=1 Tax=Aspergillus mulundensis TaxID=1810919 RepID=A0A3D8SIB0_9EURO|nr:hypothetical protein DSM5745_02702 [Aspergillus mulundensis]RDW86060.1 hypothetical protein DSM5745_02702 [Aspergillus mulundensis]
MSNTTSTAHTIRPRTRQAETKDEKSEVLPYFLGVECDSTTCAFCIVRRRLEKLSMAMAMADTSTPDPVYSQGDADADWVHFSPHEADEMGMQGDGSGWISNLSLSLDGGGSRNRGRDGSALLVLPERILLTSPDDDGEFAPGLQFVLWSITEDQDEDEFEIEVGIGNENEDKYEDGYRDEEEEVSINMKMDMDMEMEMEMEDMEMEPCTRMPNWRSAAWAPPPAIIEEGEEDEDCEVQTEPSASGWIHAGLLPSSDAAALRAYYSELDKGVRRRS